PNATYVELPGVDHLMWAGDGGAIVNEVEGFLQGIWPSREQHPTSPSEVGLTKREIEVLRLVASGRTNKQIAGILFISPKTAAVHVSSILAKLGVERRAGAATVAQQLGLIHPSTAP